jgi:hypothetical protein
MKKFILLYTLDDDLKVEYFEYIDDMEMTYNAVKSSFGDSFKLEFVGSIRNELEFVKESDIWDVIAV